MGRAAHGLLGVFDPDPDAVDARDASALRLLCRRLRGLARPLLPASRTEPLAQPSQRQRDVVKTLCLTERTPSRST